MAGSTPKVVVLATAFPHRNKAGPAGGAAASRLHPELLGPVRLFLGGCAEAATPTAPRA